GRAFVPEPRVEAGETGRARVDADLGWRDLTQGGAPDLANARNRGELRQLGSRGPEAYAATLGADDAAGKVLADQRERLAPRAKAGAAGRGDGRGAADGRGQPRVPVWGGPARATRADVPRAPVLSWGNDADDDRVPIDSPASRGIANWDRQRVSRDNY